MAPRGHHVLPFILCFLPLAFAQRDPMLRDPAAWGSSHAGQPIPEFIHGDECLFCHRRDIGSAWPKTSHGSTIRQVADAPDLAPRLRGQRNAGEIEFFLGSRHHVRFLKKAGYGKLALLSEKQEWDTTIFGDRCAGCHATAVNSATKTFAYFGLDCYTCHGVVDPGHTSDTSKVLLSKKRRAEPRVVASICASCHLRGGRSRSSGLPFSNNFVPGDNLFQDFVVNLSQADDGKLNPGDRHVWRNVRGAAIHGAETTCLACHAVHTGSSNKHRRAPPEAICNDCHFDGRPRKELRKYTVHSPTCLY